MTAGEGGDIAARLAMHGFRFEHFPELDSTNSEAGRRAEAGDPGMLWIRADRQSAGRGRSGRVWASPTGNLMATLLLRPDLPPGIAAQLSFVTALSVGDMLGHFMDGARLRFKWPNDVLANGAKIAGILLELGQDTAAKPWLAIGVGINLQTHPEDLPYRASNLSTEMGAGAQAPTADEALAQLAGAFARRFELWNRGRGFELIRSDWLARAHGFGETMTARLAAREVSGTFEGIDPSGALILKCENGSREVIHGGEVFFGSPNKDETRNAASD